MNSENREDDLSSRWVIIANIIGPLIKNEKDSITFHRFNDLLASLELNKNIGSGTWIMFEKERLW